MEYVEPGKRAELRLEARKERFNCPGFATGMVRLCRGGCGCRRHRWAAALPLRAPCCALPLTLTCLLPNPPTPSPPQDLFTEEERAKREQRATRFGTASTGLEWKPPPAESLEDAEKRRQRAERFGVEYRPKDETGLMDVGAWGGAVRGRLCQRPTAAGLCSLLRPVPASRAPFQTFRCRRPPALTPDLFEARKDASAAVPRRPEAVHVYGVDLMSTADLLKYFTVYSEPSGGLVALVGPWPVCVCERGWTGTEMATAAPSSPRPVSAHWRPSPASLRHSQTGPTFVEWINDSSANVLFADGPTATRAVAGLGAPLPPEDAPELLGAGLYGPLGASRGCARPGACNLPPGLPGLLFWPHHCPPCPFFDAPAPAPCNPHHRH